MKITIKEAIELAKKVLLSFGFSDEDATLGAELIVEGELVGKPSHGLMRLLKMKIMIDDGRVVVTKKAPRIVNETNNSVLFDGLRKPGFVVVPHAFKYALDKIKREKINTLSAGVNNTAPAAGMIGYFARLATENNLIYLGFHNSMSYVVPHGAKKPVWGTNPMTIGVPGERGPIIWDSSSAKISVGDVILAKEEGNEIEPGIGVDKYGNSTTDPIAILSGGIHPFAEHKGSGMAMMVELLAGALIGSSITNDAQWNWGSFFILINPTAFQPLNVFKHSVQKSIEYMKSMPKKDGVDEIYYPGERSDIHRQKIINTGSLEIKDTLYSQLNELL